MISFFRSCYWGDFLLFTKKLLTLVEGSSFLYLCLIIRQDCADNADCKVDDHINEAREAYHEEVERFNAALP